MGDVIGYARLSSEEQNRGQTLDQQIDRLVRAGAQEVIFDLLPGTTTARPQYRELLRRVEAGTVSKVIATRMDRLCRNAAETCRLVDLFSADGAPELSLLDDPTQISTIGGRLQLRLLGAMAQAEVERLKERSQAGKDYRKAKGCADKAPFGMVVLSDGMLAPDERKFLSLLERGEGHEPLSRADIARELFSVVEVQGFYAGHKAAWERFGLEWGRARVVRWALNPSLRGARVYGRDINKSQDRWAQVIENANEPLIDPERHLRFEAASRGHKARGGRNDTRRKHPLSSKLICGHCGKRLVRKLVKRGKPKYSCVTKSCSYRLPGERSNSISEPAAMQAVCKALSLASPQIADAIERGTGVSDDRPLKDQLAKLTERRDQYLAMLADGAEELQGAISKVEQQMADLTAAIMAPKGSDGAIDQFREQIKAGISQNPELGYPLEQIAEEWGEEANVVTVWVAMLCLSGAQAWLHEESYATATHWIDYWVHSVTVIEKTPEVKLNLETPTARFAATP